MLPASLAASLQTGSCRAVTTELLGLVEREAAGRALIFPVPIVSRTASGSLRSPAVLQRPLLFCCFVLDPYSLCYKLSRFLSSSLSERAKLCFTFIFPSVQMKFKSLSSSPSCCFVVVGVVSPSLLPHSFLPVIPVFICSPYFPLFCSLFTHTYPSPPFCLACSPVPLLSSFPPCCLMFCTTYLIFLLSEVS